MSKNSLRKLTISSNRRPIAIDLFSGAGGFSLGIEQAGFDVVAAIDSDPVHAAVYTFNFPLTEVLCADISTLSSRAIADAAARGWARIPNLGSRKKPEPAWNGEIDLIVGGPPCQGFAVMGKRTVEDERNDLVFDFCRIVTELQPRYFIMENVAGMGAEKYNELMDRLIAQFEASGYKIAQPVQVLNAADFGVPQDRQRLFLLGTRVGEPWLDYPQPLVEKKRTVKEAIADMPDIDKFAELLESDEVKLTNPQLRAMEKMASHYARQLRYMAVDPDNYAYHRLWERQLLTGSLRTVHTEDCQQRFDATPQGKVERNSRLRRLDLNSLSHTLRAGTGREKGRHTSPRPLHPTHPRVISVREAARLHSFPDWFRFHGTKWHGFRQVGNAVPPLLARAVGRKIIEALDIDPPIPTDPMELGDIDLLRMSPSQGFQYWEAESMTM